MQTFEVPGQKEVMGNSRSDSQRSERQRPGSAAEGHGATYSLQTFLPEAKQKPEKCWELERHRTYIVYLTLWAVLHAGLQKTILQIVNCFPEITLSSGRAHPMMLQVVGGSYIVIRDY